MTKIKAEFAGDMFTLDMTGHAGGSEYCAGVSTLLYTLYNRLLEMDQDVDLNEGDGEACLKVAITPESLPAIETILTGMRVMSMFYPQYINFFQKR